MSLDLNIISAGDDSSGYLPAVRNLQHDLPSLPITAWNVPRMVTDLLETCGREPHSIRSLRIFGHGVPGCQFIGSGNQLPELEYKKLGWNASRNGLYNLTSLTLLRGYFDGNGCVVLHGCQVAAGDIGRKFMEHLSRLWQVSVAASMDNQVEELSGNGPLRSLHGRIRQVLFNLPNRGLVRGRDYSITYNSVNETPETPIHMVNQIPETPLRQ